MLHHIHRALSAPFSDSEACSEAWHACFIVIDNMLTASETRVLPEIRSLGLVCTVREALSLMPMGSGMERRFAVFSDWPAVLISGSNCSTT